MGEWSKQKVKKVLIKKIDGWLPYWHEKNTKEEITLSISKIINQCK